MCRVGPAMPSGKQERVMAELAGPLRVMKIAIQTAMIAYPDYERESGTKCRAGETLLVLGASGGVGIAAIEIGKALGARVIAAASSAEKLAICRAHGADETIDYAALDLKRAVNSLTGDKGADVIYDPVGGPFTEAAIRSCAWRGRHLVIGFANGEIPRVPANLTLLKGCSLVGVFWGRYVKTEPAAWAQDLDTLFGWLQEGRLNPHIAESYPLERGAEALAALLARKVSGKLIIAPVQT